MTSDTLSAAKTNPAKQRRPAALLLMNFRTFIALIVVFVFFSVTTPNFLDVPTLVIVAKHVAVNAILGIGMTFVILTAGIDLSVGSIVGVSGMIAGYLLTHGIPLAPFEVTVFPNVLETMAITLAIGAAIGLINGLLITRLNVAPFIATLGTLYVARGAALLISDGATFSNLVGDPRFDNTGFPFLGSGTLAGVPVSIVALVVFAAVSAYVTTKTPFGRQVYAVGGNERAAALSGVRVNLIKVAAYMISGFCAAFAGLIIASELVAAHPASGETFELNAIAAAVLGGTSLSGGRGTIAGTLVGAFVIGVLGDGLVMLGVSSFWQMVIKGLVIIAAVVLDQMQRRMYRRFALQAQLS
jgi:erythritol transport system permease protein